MKSYYSRSVLTVMCIFTIMFSFGQVPEEKLGWKLGAQAYTFKEFTFFEAIEKIKSCGLSFVEAFPGQEIGGGIPGVMGTDLSEQSRIAILEKLDQEGVELISYGVVGAKGREQWLDLFEFANRMGIEVITAEPVPEEVPMVRELAKESGIRVAIHNHPKPSTYWHPATVLEVLKDPDYWIGACADTGHYVRSGLEPLECISMLEGNIIELHLKDLNKRDAVAHDVIWGTGVSNLQGILEELKRQGFRGAFFVEYEHNWKNSVPEIRRSVEFFRQTVQELQK